MPQPGYVYIVHGVETPYIKVGKSTNVKKRLTTLEQGTPFALRLLYIELVHDMDAVEKALKQRYARFNTRGEWFELPLELLQQQWPIDEFLGIFHPAARPRQTVRDRLLQLLERKPGLTARELQRDTKGTRCKEIRSVLATLLEEGHITTYKEGKRVTYLRLLPQPFAGDIA